MDPRIVLGALAALGVGALAALSGMIWLAPDDPEIASQAAEAPTASAPTPSPSESLTSEAAKGPRFNTVRVEPNGSGLVAGQAEPGTTVAVLADDAVVTEVPVDAEGRFVAFLDLAASPSTVVLSLRDASGAASEETVVLARPATADVEMAEVAPTADVAPPGSEAADIQSGQVAVATPFEEVSDPLASSSPPAVELSATAVDPEAASPTALAEAAQASIGGLGEGARPADPEASGGGAAPGGQSAADPAVSAAQDETEIRGVGIAPEDEEPASDQAPAEVLITGAEADPEGPAPVLGSAVRAGARSPIADPAEEVGATSVLDHVATNVLEVRASPPQAPDAPSADPAAVAVGLPAPAPTSNPVASILMPDLPDAPLGPQGDSVAPTVVQIVAEGGEDAEAASARLTSSPPMPLSLEESAGTTPSPPAFESAAGLELRPSQAPHPNPRTALEVVSAAPVVEAVPTTPSEEPFAVAIGSAPGQEADISPEVEPAAASAPVVDEGGPAAPTAPEQLEAGQAIGLVSDIIGVRVLQPALPPAADPELLSTVALDAIAYDGTGDVTASGRGPAGGTIRLYLDNARVGEAVISPDGVWTAPLSAIEPGIYTLRVDQVDRSGQVVSRIETPFQRERRSDLAALMAEAQVAGQTIAVRVVQPGNTLWAIARDRYGEPLMYVRVFQANRDRIRDPDLIYPGQVFVLPATEGR